MYIFYIFAVGLSGFSDINCFFFVTHIFVLSTMSTDNACSLSISYMHLSEFAAVLAIWLVEQPTIMLELFDSVAMDVAKISFAEYDTIHSAIHVRITNLPLTDELRDLRQLHLNSFVQVNGVVTRRTSVFPQLQLVRFDCIKCGFTSFFFHYESSLQEMEWQYFVIGFERWLFST